MPESAPYRYLKILNFKDVDPSHDAPTLISFGRDLYMESLGGDAEFNRDYGVHGEKFPDWIESCAAAHPGFAALLTEDMSPIGMVVLGRAHGAADTGLVHHFYIKPDHRSQGFGGLLDDYARTTLKAAGFVRARLNVTARNHRAVRFYEAQGWKDVSRRGAASLRFLEVAL